jgi:hypothetical protein
VSCTAYRTGQEPYHKNDTCYAEQKDFDAVCKTAGYFRFDTPAGYAALAEVYRFLYPLYNYWYPSFKLVSKGKRADGRYKKVYEKAPPEALRGVVGVAGYFRGMQAGLRHRKALNNPAALNRWLNEAVEKLLKLHREKGYCGNAPCQGGGQAPAA